MSESVTQDVLLRDRPNSPEAIRDSWYKASLTGEVRRLWLQAVSATRRRHAKANVTHSAAEGKQYSLFILYGHFPVFVAIIDNQGKRERICQRVCYGRVVRANAVKVEMGSRSAP